MQDNNNLIRPVHVSLEDRQARKPALPANPFRAPTHNLDAEPEDPPVPLSQYLWILRRQLWKIVTFVLVAVVATIIVSKRITPVYESVATIDIDRQMPAGIIGQDANRATLNDADQFLATQVKLIQSDSVLRPVAEQYNLRERENENPTPLPGNTVPVKDSPVLLKKLSVTRPPNTYLLLIAYRSTDPRLAANVANGVANSYLEHTYKIRFDSSAKLADFMEKQLEELKAKMERSSAALAGFEKDLNVINPEEKTSILSSRLLQLNTEYTNAQTDRVRKETAYRSVSSGTMEAAQVSSQGESLKRLSESLAEANQKFADVKTHYGVSHPEYRKAAAQVAEIERQIQQTKDSIVQRVAVEYKDAIGREAMLEKAVADTKAEFDRLNARSFEYQALKREAEADKNLYEELITKIKEAGINAGFQNSAIRIADLARPAVKPVFPKLTLNAVLAFIFSLLIAVTAAVVSDMLNSTVRDPEQVARTLKAEVVGSLPVVKELRGRIAGAPEPVKVLPANGRYHGGTGLTGYDEAIRTLRNSILLADFDRRLRSIMVTSASPAEGKSTTASHLAIAHAQQGRRTLLIDGDLRRPSVHRRFDIPNTMGLSNALVGEVSWRSVLVQRPSLPNLDILPAGPPSRRAADLVGTPLMDLIEEATREYDLVVLDTPPLLGFSEPLQMATAVDGVLVIAKAGETNRKALGSALSILVRLRANVIGVVLNEIRADAGNGYYYHYYSPKYYKYYHKPDRV
jgi:capsular exopolysaccharide synthesis family protein